jgi:hypothetical protein
MAASSLNMGNPNGHNKVRQQNQMREERREVVNEVIPERNVQFRENRNQVLAAGDIYTICGDVHSDKFIFSEHQP